jgi:hypothetical protein
VICDRDAERSKGISRSLRSLCKVSSTEYEVDAYFFRNPLLYPRLTSTLVAGYAALPRVYRFYPDEALACRIDLPAPMLRESLTRLSITLEEFGDAANRWERNGGSLIHLPGPFQKLRGEIERVRALLQDTQILSLLEADASVDDIILLPLEDAATALEELRQDAEWASKEQAIPSILPRGSDFLRDYLKRISNCRLAVEALLDIQQQ